MNPRDAANVRGHDRSGRSDMDMVEEQLEWAIRHPDGRIEATASETYARALLAIRDRRTGEPTRPGAIVVCRRVSPWVEATR